MTHLRSTPRKSQQRKARTLRNARPEMRAVDTPDYPLDRPGVSERTTSPPEWVCIDEIDPATLLGCAERAPADGPSADSLARSYATGPKRAPSR
jgi:hypothetical protein